MKCANSKEKYSVEYSMPIFSKLTEKHYTTSLKKNCMNLNHSTRFAPLIGTGIHTSLFLSCQNTSTAKELISFLRKNNIYAASGYPLMDRNAQTPVANENSGKILEIPLENNEPKMNHIISLLKQYDEYSRNNHHL